MRRASLILLALSVVLAGCASMRHDPTPQQRFIDALRRGNGTEASTVWIQMTGEQRAALTHGIGLNQTASADEAKAALTRRAADSAPDDSATGVFDTGDETIEIPGLKAPAATQNFRSVLESAEHNQPPTAH